MKAKTELTVFSILLCLMTVSCVKEKLETIYKKQETQIDSYLSKNSEVKRDSTIVEADGSTRDTTWTDTLDIIYNNGAARMITKKGSGPELSSEGAVSFYYAGYIFSSSPSTLFATNHRETAEGAKFELTDADYELIEADMTKARMIDGLRNGLIGVRSGEECEIVFSGKYGFGDEIFGTIPVNSALLYKIWVVGVSNE
jgi:FKBP-type peptidyl-prolyl cis-trans isomerase